MTEPAEITVTNWKTKSLNVWNKFYIWAKLHPGIMIPATAYLAGMATPMIVKIIWRIV